MKVNEKLDLSYNCFILSEQPRKLARSDEVGSRQVSNRRYYLIPVGHLFWISCPTVWTVQIWMIPTSEALWNLLCSRFESSSLWCFLLLAKVLLLTKYAVASELVCNMELDINHVCVPGSHPLNFICVSCLFQNMNTYDPWGKGYGAPVRDGEGNVVNSRWSDGKNGIKEYQDRRARVWYCDDNIL